MSAKRYKRREHANLTKTSSPIRFAVPLNLQPHQPLVQSNRANPIHIDDKKNRNADLFLRSVLLFLQASERYIYFDADPVDDTKKKRKAANSSAAAAAAAKESSDRADQPGPSKPTKGRKKK